MDNFYDLTTESMPSDIPVELTYNQTQMETETPLSPSQKRKRKYEEMEVEANEPVIPDIQQSETQNVDNGIEIVPPPAKKQRLGSDEPTLSRLLYSNNFSDIVFQVQNKQFHCIKAIFAVKSEKFEEMLFPKNENGIDQQQDVKFIAIHDITPDAFTFIRDFCYDMNIDLNLENVVDVLHASKIYQLKKLKEMCIDFLKKIDSVEGLLTILKQIADTQDESILLGDEINDLLGNNTNLLQTCGSELIESDIFPQLPLQIICKIIENDNLGVKEEDLWNAISNKTWIHEPELKRLIRFCLMDISFLYNQVKPSGVLSEGELVSIYEKKLGLAENCEFNCNERTIVKKRKRRASKKKKTQKDENFDVKEEIEAVIEDGGEAAQEVVEESPVTKKRGRSRSKRTKKAAASEETQQEESSPPKTRSRRGRSKRGRKK